MGNISKSNNILPSKGEIRTGLVK